MPTHLPQNQFITNSAMPTAESAVAISEPSGLAATAALISNPVAKATKGKAGMAVDTVHVRGSTAGTGLRVGEASADLPATSEFMDVTARRDEHSIYEPTSSTGGPQEAPAGSAPNTAAPVGALVHWEGPWWLVLLEVLDLPPIKLDDDLPAELPLFIRDGEHLRRWEA